MIFPVRTNEWTPKTRASASVYKKQSYIINFNYIYIYIEAFIYTCVHFLFFDFWPFLLYPYSTAKKGNNLGQLYSKRRPINKIKCPDTCPERKKHGYYLLNYPFPT